MTRGPTPPPSWLCVAYAFAPINRSGTHRTLGFVRHLDTLGWPATVLTVEPHDEPLDRALLRQVPSSTRIIRTRWVNIIEAIKQRCGLRSSRGPGGGAMDVDEAVQDYGRAVSQFNDAMHGGWALPAARGSMRDWISRLLMTPDSRVGWIVPAVARGMREIRRRRPTVIYSTSPYMSAHLIALLLSQWSRVPWVADFRDPWRGNPFRELGHPSLDLWDSFLERAVMRGAAHVLCNTPTMTENLCQRLPHVAARCSTILNGFDGDLFRCVVPRRAAPPGHFALMHAGEFYGPRSPQVWFEGLRTAVRRRSELAERVHLVLLGSEHFNGRHLRVLAEESGVGAFVEVVGHRPHGETISLMAGSDALMLAGPAGAGSELQIPNKLFEYLAVRRPIIAAVSPDSPTVSVLDEARAQAIVCTPDDAEAVAAAIEQLAVEGPPVTPDAWSGVDAFERRHRAEELLEVFHRVGARRGADRSVPQPPRFRGALRGQGDRPYRWTAHADADPGSSVVPLDSPERADEPDDAVESCTPAASRTSPLKDGTPCIGPVSVILTVRDDAEGLVVAMEGLAHQVRPPDEIVVADGGSRDEAVARMRQTVARHPSARLLSGAPCNIAEGRNRAIRAARFDIIACTDAGCRPRADWLDRLTAPFADPTVEVVGGWYEIDARSGFERVSGPLAMPVGPGCRDPRTFNPSARSLAFRRATWERAGGFPHWLMTAEDTLFDLKLRSLDPAPIYVFAADAVVAWRPRSNMPALFRQFAGYARGEAHIGRGRVGFRYTTLRYAALVAWLAACWALLGSGQLTVAMVCAAIAAALVVRPHIRIARRATRRAGRRPQSRNTASNATRAHHGAGRTTSPCRAIPPALAVLLREWITLAGWVGYWRGARERRRDPARHVETIRGYLGSDSADVEFPPWSIRSVPLPRTLIVTWHWAPTNRASANVLAALFQHAPSGSFRVLTRHLPTPHHESRTHVPRIPAEYVDWPLPDDRPVRLWTWLTDIATVWKLIRRADAVDADWPVERVMAVFPHRFSLMAGWLIARRLGVPFVAYMHDLCSEALITRVWAKRRFWRIVDRLALRDAWMVCVPTREFAEHYRGRDITRTWVLPHCLPTGVASSEPPRRRGRLRLIYSGNVYEPHEDAIAAVLAAAKGRSDVEIQFQSNPHPLLREQGATWMARREAMEQLHTADAFLVALGSNTPYPREIHCCFPSKLTDYIAVGRPILAVVPPGCFVDRFIRATGCGIVVNTLDRREIGAAFELLHDERRRARMTRATQTVAMQIEPDHWFNRLKYRLVVGPPTADAEELFPETVPPAPLEFGARADHVQTASARERPPSAGL